MLKQEEERFGETLENGLRVLENALAALPQQDGAVLDGETVFLLYDTYGSPLDLTADICRERHIVLDGEGFDKAMGRQRTQARAAGKFKTSTALDYAGEKTNFLGYDGLHAHANVLGLYLNGAAVDVIEPGMEAVVVLDQTPFYAESGGQVGDRGVLEAVGTRFRVSDTHKRFKVASPATMGWSEIGELRVGQEIDASVDGALRARSMRNHSATHLMHKALRDVLGGHVAQKGSLVDADKTRFDFSHDAPMTADQIRRVEDEVNAEILKNQATQVRNMAYDDAVAAGAMALFGEKYGDVVRVLDIGNSTELCGGTHVSRTGDIGLFKVTAESGVASGVRRIEAVTGEGALALLQHLDRQVHEAAAALKAPAEELNSRIAQVLASVRSLERELAAAKSKLAAAQGQDLVSQAIDIRGVKVLAASVPGADVKTLRETMDRLKDKLKSAAIVLGAVNDGKVALIAGVTADAMTRVRAGELVNFVAQQVGGKGGGKPDMAQAGGTLPGNLPAALLSVRDWADQRL